LLGWLGKAKGRRGGKWWIRRAVVRTTTHGSDVVCFKLLHQLVPVSCFLSFLQLLLLQSMPLPNDITSTAFLLLRLLFRTFFARASFRVPYEISQLGYMFLRTSTQRLSEYIKQLLTVEKCVKLKGKVIPVLRLNTTPWRSLGERRCSSTHSWPRH
jgi:hypothetical protein